MINRRVAAERAASEPCLKDPLATPSHTLPVSTDEDHQHANSTLSTMSTALEETSH